MIKGEFCIKSVILKELDPAHQFTRIISHQFIVSKVIKNA